MATVKINSKAGGATVEQIETLLVHNPRRFFEGTPPPRL